MKEEAFSTAGAGTIPADFLPALPREFYLQDTLTVAKRLLNCLLVHDSPDGLTVGRISETEAYTQNDPACHAFTRKTVRNAPLFGPPGHTYMHLNYGLHWCFNAVTAPEHVAAAVLVRALEPLAGMELMRQRRGLPEQEVVRENANAAAPARERIKIGNFLCGGPGKLTVAMGITPALNNADLTTGRQLWIAPPLPSAGDLQNLENYTNIQNNEDTGLENIIATTRIGITKAADYPWRFYVRDEPYVSRK